MPAFSRAILPVDATHPSYPGGLMSIGQSGKIQSRSTQQVGREWTETYGVMPSTSATVRAFLAEVNDLWRNGTSFTTTHPLLTLMGAGGGTPLVNGASQTGTSLITDGWPISTAILKAGDLITITGSTVVREITADVSSNGSGQATLSINPPIYTGGSPADNAPIDTTPDFTVRLVAVDMPTANVARHYGGMVLTFREVVS